MNEPFENAYFNWLCAKVIDTRKTSPGLTYWALFGILHRTEFVWELMGDDNRVEDGKELRREFILMEELPDNPEWRTVLGCSVFEMLVAFSRRAEWLTDRPAREWFWEMIDNVGLRESNDGNIDPNQVVDILDQLIWRTYDEHGNGSLFPLRMSAADQKHIEIWRQFCEYLVDQEESA
jgi:hypothetical protein